MKNTKTTIMAAGAIIVAAVLRSIDGIFLRPKLYTLPVELVVFVEHLLGLCVFLPFLILARKNITRLPRKAWGAVTRVSVFGGILGTIAITKAFFLAIDGKTTFATVIILQKLQPLFALGGASLILKEKLPTRFYLRALCAIIASFILAFGYGQSLGDIAWGSNAAVFAVFASFAFGSSTVFGKKLVSHLNTEAATGLRFLTTAVLIGIYLLLTGGGGDIMMIDTTQWMMFLTIVVTSGAVALFLYYYGLKKVTASVASILELARPLSAVLLDYIINNNTLSIAQRVATLVLIVVMMKISRIQR